jgi:hypothetical protein
MTKYICDKCGGVSYSSSSQAPCPYCKEVEKMREGQLIVYKNGSRYEVGKIKRIVEDGAFVFYHEGETAAKTPFDCIFPIENEHCIKQTSLGGE